MKMFITITMLLISQLCCAQTVPIDTCNGDNLTRPTNDAVNKVFSPQGLYIDRKYDWSLPQINCHINRALQASAGVDKINSQMKTRAIIGYIVMIPGGALLMLGAASGGIIKGTTVPGLLIGAGGYAIGFGGRKKNRQKIERLNIETQYHVNEVRKYYKAQAW